MILYFSGTGNSRFVAKHLGHFLSDEVISINDLLKSKQSQTFRSEKPFVFVVPSYMSRMPLKVEEFLMNCHFQGHRHAYFILTAGTGYWKCRSILSKDLSASSFELLWNSRYSNAWPIM